MYKSILAKKKPHLVNEVFSNFKQSSIEKRGKKESNQVLDSNETGRKQMNKTNDNLEPIIPLGIDSINDLLLEKSNFFDEKALHLGVDKLSETQQYIFSKIFNSSIDVKERAWIKEASSEYLELIETTDYIDAKSKILLALTSGESSVEINHRYALASTVAAFDCGIEILISKQDMKAGKSYAHSWLAVYHPAVRSSLSLCHLKSINIANANTKSKEFNFKFNNYIEIKDNKLSQSEHNFSTVNSVHSVANITGFVNYSVVLIDESNAMASYITSNTLSAKHKSIEVIRSIVDNSSFVVFGDAHLGEATERFCNLVTTGEKITMMVVNKYKHWANVEGFIIQEKAAGINKNITELQIANIDDEAVGSFFASAQDAKTTHATISNILGYSQEEYPLITSATAAQELIKELKNTPAKFSKLKGFCASPSLGIGISIECENYKSSFMYAKNSEHVGDSDSQLQMPFRLRNIDNLFLVICNDSTLEAKIPALNKELIESDQLTEIGNFVLDTALNADGSDKMKAAIRVLVQKDHYGYARQIRAASIRDLFNRFDYILETLKGKGISLKLIDPEFGEVTAALLKKTQIQMKKKELDATVGTPVINKDEMKEIAISMLSSSEEIDIETQNKIKVYAAELNIQPIPDDDTDSDGNKYTTEEAIKAYDDRAIIKRNNLQRAVSPKALINKIARAMAFGATTKAFDNYSVDLASTAPEMLLLDYEYDKLLSSLVSIETNNQGMVSAINGTIDTAALRGDKSTNIVSRLNELVTSRNALKVNGSQEALISNDSSKWDLQIKKKIEDRLGIRFKANKKTKQIQITGRTKKQFTDAVKIIKDSAINGVIVADLDVINNAVKMLKPEALIIANATTKNFKLTPAAIINNINKALTTILNASGVTVEITEIKNGYIVTEKAFDAMHMASIAIDRDINSVKKELKRIDSLNE